MKDILYNKKTIYTIITLIIVIILGFLLSNIYRNKVNVKKILSTKYDSVSCIDKSCNGVVASKIENDIVKIKIIDKNGKVVGNYSYKKNTKIIKKPIYLTNNYLLMKKENKKDNIEYSINSKNANEKYKTKNDLSHISNYVVLETINTKIDYKYNIINYDGKILIKNITDYESYKDGLIFYGIKDGKSLIFNNRGKKILSGYKIAKETYDYLILKSVKNDLYYFFDINDLKIENEGFYSYTINNDNSLEVVRKVNNQKQVSLINVEGKETNKKSSKFLFEIVKEIKNNIDKNTYNLYEESVIDENTTKVLVDNIRDNSFGVYDIKEKNYDKMYDYTTNASYSEIDKLQSKDNVSYLQIICNKPNCYESKMYIYDTKKHSILFKQNDSNNFIEEYNYYANNYKVVKYTRKSSDDYKNKYVLYDKKDKEILKNDNPIIVLNSNLLIGIDYDKALLYSVKKNKIINNEQNLAEKKDDKYFIYSNVILDLKGNELYRASKGYTLYYYNDFVYLINNNNIKMYDILAKKVYRYRLKTNESSIMKNNENMIPFKSVIFINNNTKKYSKIINIKSNKVKKINHEQIFSITQNEDYSRLYLITTNTINKKIKYGLYILD